MNYPRLTSAFVLWEKCILALAKGRFGKLTFGLWKYNIFSHNVNFDAQNFGQTDRLMARRADGWSRFIKIWCWPTMCVSYGVANILTKQIYRHSSFAGVMKSRQQTDWWFSVSTKVGHNSAVIVRWKDLSFGSKKNAAYVDSYRLLAHFNRSIMQSYWVHSISRTINRPRSFLVLPNVRYSLNVLYSIWSSNHRYNSTIKII